MTWSKTIQWFKKKEPTVKQYEWTHTYENMVGDNVRCVLISDGVTPEQMRPLTVYNENGVTVHLFQDDVTRIIYDRGGSTY
jgi:hypothetical protein